MLYKNLANVAPFLGWSEVEGPGSAQLVSGLGLDRRARPNQVRPGPESDRG